MENKTVIIKVKIKSKNGKDLPDWGLGPGVLATQKVEYPVPDNGEVSEFREAIGLMEVYQQLLENTLEPIFDVK